MTRMLLAILFLFVSVSEAAKMQAVYVDFSKMKIADYLNPSDTNIIIEKMDTQSDGQTDTYFVFKEQPDGKRRVLLRHMFDLNGDKKIDLVKHFEGSKMVRTEADLDHDGLVDVVSEYDPANGKLLKKTEAAGKTNIWRYWHDGQLRLKEMDRNSDQKPDIWVHYRGDRIIKTEIDVDFDGKNIRVEKEK